MFASGSVAHPVHTGRISTSRLGTGATGVGPHLLSMVVVSSLVPYPIGLVGAGYGQQSDVQGGLQGRWSEAWEKGMQTGRGPAITSRLQAPESSRTICSGQLEEKTRELGTTEAPLQTWEEQWDSMTEKRRDYHFVRHTRCSALRIT